ncbi:MAG: ATP-dependent sacrificial sulfur transferase LarE [Myxococcales bacterium]|jgi:uncharacterized protein|nr:ATP-dependent sacrificial sulfur transferase LarE [Myxococcales bacterium]
MRSPPNSAVPHRADKHTQLRRFLQSLDKVAIGYSGGVDSAFLLALARDAIGDNAVPILIRGPQFPARETQAALDVAQHLGARVVVIDVDLLGDPTFVRNGPDRCFACKRALFQQLKDTALALGCQAVLEGSHSDDTADFRPGLRAIRELGVHTPLLDIGFTKAEIRHGAKALGLPNWQQPARPCLATRIPYGQPITRQRLARIETAENALDDVGFSERRVRDHGDLCRLELPAPALAQLTTTPLRQKVIAAMRAAGYDYVSVDLEGFRSGSMNGVLPQEDRDEPPH